MGPFLFEDGDEDKVKFVDQGTFVPQSLFVFRALDDEVDDKVSDTCGTEVFSAMLTSRWDNSMAYLDTALWVALSNES